MSTILNSSQNGFQPVFATEMDFVISRVFDQKVHLTGIPYKLDNLDLVLQPDLSAFIATPVSGFYGPGAWAAWVITLLVSWIPIIRNDYSHNLHFIGYALYTNWTAIDLIRLLKLASEHQKASGKLDSRLDDSIVTCLAVLSLGVLHAVAQNLVCLYKQRRQTTTNKTALGRRQSCIIIGLILPYLLSTWILHLTNNAGVLTRVMTIEALVFFPALFYPLLSSKISRTIPHSNASSLYWGLSSNIVLLAMMEMYTEVAMRTPKFKKIFVFVPCAPQGIEEWDQAFSLLVALFLFLYEYGLSLVNVTRKGIKTFFPLLDAIFPFLRNFGAWVFRGTYSNVEDLEAGLAPVLHTTGLLGSLVHPPPPQPALRLTDQPRSRATL